MPTFSMQTNPNDYYKDINNVYSLLTVEPIEMEFGYSLIPMVDESSGGKLISRSAFWRSRRLDIHQPDAISPMPTISSAICGVPGP